MRRLAFVFVCMTLFAGTQCPAGMADGWWPFGAKDEPEKTPPPAHVEKESSEAPTTAPRTTRLGKMSTPPGKTSGATSSKSTVSGSSTAGAKTTTSLHPSPAPSAKAEAEETPWYTHSPFSSNHGPKSPFTAKDKAEPSRNAWVPPKEEPASFSPLQAMSNGAHRVSEGTKNAWHKTVDVLTPGDETPKKPPTRIAKRDAEPSMLSRMGLAAKPKEEPRTVTEWMSQDRLKP